MAIVIAVGLGLGIVYLPQQIAQSTSSLTQTSSTSGSVTSVTTFQGTVTESFSLVKVAGAAEPNPALTISDVQSILLQGNATRIAYALAAQLNELPISSPNVTQGGFTTYYMFQTANHSTIEVSAWPTASSLFQVNYDAKDYSQEGNATTLNPNFSMTSADAEIRDILSALGVPISNVTLYDQTRSLTPNNYQVQQSQSYQNIPLSYVIGRNPDNTTFYYGETPGFYYDFNPADGQLKNLMILQFNWFDISYNFPLRINSTEAQTIAENYVIHTLGVDSISSAQVYFTAIANRYLYYAVTVSVGNTEYILTIDPSSGQVGLPTNAVTAATTITTTSTYTCSVSTLTGTNDSTTTFSLTTQCQPMQ